MLRVNFAANAQQSAQEFVEYVFFELCVQPRLTFLVSMNRTVAPGAECTSLSAGTAAYALPKRGVRMAKGLLLVESLSFLFLR